MSFDLAESLYRLEITSSGQERSEDNEYSSEAWPTGAARRKPNHTVEYRYPELSLIPHMHELYLSPPPAAEFRQHPGHNASGVGPLNATLMTVSSAANKPSDLLVPADDDFVMKSSSVQRLAEAMQDLLSAPGRTQLSFVTSRLNYGPVQVRIKLATMFNDGRKRNLFFCIYQEDWNTLGIGYAWVKIMLDLRLRPSDIACHHVRSQLLRQGQQHLADQDASDAGWGNKIDYTAIDFFFEKVRIIAANVVKGKEVNKKMVKARKGRAQVMLPCGHTVILEDGVSKIDHSFCLRYKCSICRMPVINEEDNTQLEVLKDTARHMADNEN